MSDRNEGHNHTENCAWFECRLNAKVADWKKRAEAAEAALETARAVALEEARRLLDEAEAVAVVGFDQDAANPEREVPASQLLELLAPLPSTLRAVPVETLEKVREALAPKALRAQPYQRDLIEALALLDAVKR